MSEMIKPVENLRFNNICEYPLLVTWRWSIGVGHLMWCIPIHKLEYVVMKVEKSNNCLNVVVDN